MYPDRLKRGKNRQRGRTPSRKVGCVGVVCPGCLVRGCTVPKLPPQRSPRRTVKPSNWICFERLGLGEETPSTQGRKWMVLMPWDSSDHVQKANPVRNFNTKILRNGLPDVRKRLTRAEIDAGRSPICRKQAAGRIRGCGRSRLWSGRCRGRRSL